jgi:multiple sugar transport system permease protein
MPLCKPAIAAMAALEFTFIYNDFFWALMLMSTQDKRPITAALNTINGQYYTNYNLLAAAALLAAVPTVLVFLACSATSSAVCRSARPRADRRRAPRCAFC